MAAAPRSPAPAIAHRFFDAGAFPAMRMHAQPGTDSIAVPYELFQDAGASAGF
jgi:hypothetical protein